METFFTEFFNNFPELLLCKIYVFNIINVNYFIQILVIPWDTQILIVSNFWLIGIKIRKSYQKFWWTALSYNYVKLDLTELN